MLRPDVRGPSKTHTSVILMVLVCSPKRRIPTVESKMLIIAIFYSPSMIINVSDVDVRMSMSQCVPLLGVCMIFPLASIMEVCQRGRLTHSARRIGVRVHGALS